MSDDLVSVQMSQPMCIMWAKDIKYLCDRIEELEAKLAKAVEAIETMQVSSDAMMLYVARTTLAELTGGKDD